MTLVDVRLSSHVLIPDNVPDGRRSVRNGWKCKHCPQHWDELPPVAERLDGCRAEERT